MLYLYIHPMACQALLQPFMEKMSWHQHIPINCGQGKQAWAAEVSVKQLNTVISAKHRCKGKVGWEIRAEWPFLEGTMGIYCRGQGALRLQPCGVAQRPYKEQKSSGWGRTSPATAKLKLEHAWSKREKERRWRRLVAVALLLLPKDHPRLGIHSVSQQLERPSSAPLILMVSWAVTALAATLHREPSDSKKRFPMSTSAATPPALPTPSSPQELHCVNLKKGLDPSFLCCTKQGAEILSIFCAELEKLVLTKCWRKQLYSNSTDEWLHCRHKRGLGIFQKENTTVSLFLQVLVQPITDAVTTEINLVCPYVAWNEGRRLWTLPPSCWNVHKAGSTYLCPQCKQSSSVTVSSPKTFFHPREAPSSFSFDILTQILFFSFLLCLCVLIQHIWVLLRCPTKESTASRGKQPYGLSSQPFQNQTIAGSKTATTVNYTNQVSLQIGNHSSEPSSHPASPSSSIKSFSPSSRVQFKTKCLESCCLSYFRVKHLEELSIISLFQI